MAAATDLELTGVRGTLVVRRWDAPSPGYLVVIAHGYGEHSGRYAHVAARLLEDGAAVYAPDHAGHGRSAGERAWGTLIDDMVTDLHTVVGRATADHPNTPVVLIGHSLGGLIAARYTQRNGGLAALALSAPVVGGNPVLAGLLALEDWPEVPIDPAVLSRDPAVGEAYAADPLVAHDPMPRAMVEESVAVIETVAQTGSLGDLPTLWLHGTDDQLAPLDATEAAMARIGGSVLTTRIYQGARHEVFNETNSAEVLGDLIDFLGVVR